MEIRLVPLRCPECYEKIPAGERENVYFCPSCGKGFEVEKGEWREMEVVYASSREKPFVYLPFWWIEYSIKAKEKREEVEAFFKETAPFLFNALKEKKVKVWIPAFGTTNRYLLLDDIGLHFTLSPPEIKPGNFHPMKYGKYPLKEAVEIGKLILAGICGDFMVFERRLDVEFLNGKIVGIPFAREKGILRELLTGKRMFADAVEGVSL